MEWPSMAPLALVASTTLYAGWRSIFDNFLRVRTFAVHSTPCSQ